MRPRRSVSAACILALLGLPALAIARPAPKPQLVAQNVWLIPGSFPEQREPDGNTIIFSAPAGLIVMDTGRHPWHTGAILDFAHARNQPIAAIINSHWHLDHTSGNAAIKQAFPKAHVYASNAIDGAIDTFFPQSAAGDKSYLNSGAAIPPETTEDLNGDLATMAAPQMLRPDMPVVASGILKIAELNLEIHLAPNAATDGDVWVYSPSTRVAAVGDLVTLPVPFLDTACVRGWKAALDAVSATPFVTLIPGHGPPMTREQFAAYRTAFFGFSTCAASTRSRGDCTADWLAATAALRLPEAASNARATSMAGDYVDLLRAHGGNSSFCKAP